MGPHDHVHDHVPTWSQFALPSLSTHTMLPCQDVAQLPQHVSLEQVIAPDCSALPSLLYLTKSLSSFGALSSEVVLKAFHNPRTELIPPPLCFYSILHSLCHDTYDIVLSLCIPVTPNRPRASPREAAGSLSSESSAPWTGPWHGAGAQKVLGGWVSE